MQKEEKIVVILLIMVLLSLIILYVLVPVTPYEPFTNESNINDKVYIEGKIINKKVTKNNHWILTISPDTKGINTIKVFIPNKIAKELNNINKNTKIGAYGIVKDYYGEKEIVIQNKNDIIIID